MHSDFMITPSPDAGFILFLVFVLSFLVLLYYYLVIFGRIAFLKKKPKSADTNIPVTIIISAKNEEENLQRNLPSVLSQNYPEFEVIVVNDYSTDDTGLILEELERRYNNLRTITIKQESSGPIGKKYPLTLGLKGAKYDTVIFTDADCKPKSPDWIRTMVRNYSPGVEIVLGYGAYEKLPGLLNKLIRFDAFSIALQYLSFAKGGNPYMGVGRNLSYQKELFFRNKGFASHTHIPSGDDDLFINKVARANNTAIEIEEESHTVSRAKRTLHDWFTQKRRHLTTGKYYRFKTKFMLGLLYISKLIFIGTFIALLALGYAHEIIISIFLAKILIQMFIFKQSMNKFKEKGMWLLTPFFELFLMFCYPYLILTNRFYNKSKWS
jgi:cellulose synthase/poly-beta-1,6-N-acetylglucosamine synthase-like glycosyltransferase